STNTGFKTRETHMANFSLLTISLPITFIQNNEPCSENQNPSFCSRIRYLDNTIALNYFADIIR
ncbi:MAG: hypothetical protein OXI94_04225, partial [Gemmatimonadota bacterium]|nr:hypothetical protein [Gemmatimonadota bacterium]